MGKGRQLAGIIAENWVQPGFLARLICRGRHKAVWISESADLVHDCRRDLRDIGFEEISVVNLRDSPYGVVMIPKQYSVLSFFDLETSRLKREFCL